MSNRTESHRSETGRTDAERTVKKQDWRSNDRDLKSGEANIKRASDGSSDERVMDKRETDKHRDRASDAKSQSPDSRKSRDQRR
jgi:hypothetical protein